MALKKISKEHNVELIRQASNLTVLSGHKVWEQQLLERYIEEGIARDKLKRHRYIQKKDEKDSTK